MKAQMICHTEIKEIPMLFSTPMVCAILDGTKTETRRVIKTNCEKFSAIVGGYDSIPKMARFYTPIGDNNPEIDDIKVRYNVGDIIWVRETWMPYLRGTDNNGWRNIIKFKADGHEIDVPEDETEWFDKLTKDGKYTYKSSMFLKRKFARIFLEITEIGIERLNDISERDAMAEGIVEVTKDGIIKKYCVLDDGDISTTEWKYMPYTAKECYKNLWENINGTRTWDLNPFVWRIAFKRI